MARQRRGIVSIDERLSTFAERTLTLEEREFQQGFADRLIKPMVRKWSTFIGERSGANSVEKVRHKLSQAGNPSGLGPVEFVGLRLLLALGLGAGAFLLFFVTTASVTSALLFAAALGAFGFMLPGIWLS
ncbi:MAG: hypothetical protein ACR2OO_00475 [Thermomicrobiales bacterium]